MAVTNSTPTGRPTAVAIELARLLLAGMVALQKQNAVQEDEPDDPAPQSAASGDRLVMPPKPELTAAQAYDELFSP